MITAHPLIQVHLIAPQLLLWIALPHHGDIMLATNYLSCRCYSVPFGQHAGLMKQMRDRVDIHPALEGLLESFVEHRNQLTHRLGDVPGWDLETPEGRDVASKFLSN